MQVPPWVHDRSRGLNKSPTSSASATRCHSAYRSGEDEDAFYSQDDLHIAPSTVARMALDPRFEACLPQRPPSRTDAIRRMIADFDQRHLTTSSPTAAMATAGEKKREHERDRTYGVIEESHGRLQTPQSKALAAAPDPFGFLFTGASDGKDALWSSDPLFDECPAYRFQRGGTGDSGHNQEDSAGTAEALRQQWAWETAHADVARAVAGGRRGPSTSDPSRLSENHFLSREHREMLLAMRRGGPYPNPPPLAVEGTDTGPGTLQRPANAWVVGGGEVFEDPVRQQMMAVLVDLERRRRVLIADDADAHYVAFWQTHRAHLEPLAAAAARRVCLVDEPAARRRVERRAEDALNEAARRFQSALFAPRHRAGGGPTLLAQLLHAAVFWPHYIHARGLWLEESVTRAELVGRAAVALAETRAWEEQIVAAFAHAAAFVRCALPPSDDYHVRLARLSAPQRAAAFYAIDRDRVVRAVVSDHYKSQNGTAAIEHAVQGTYLSTSPSPRRAEDASLIASSAGSPVLASPPRWLLQAPSLSALQHHAQHPQTTPPAHPHPRAANGWENDAYDDMSADDDDSDLVYRDRDGGGGGGGGGGAAVAITESSSPYRYAELSSSPPTRDQVAWLMDRYTS